MLDLDIRAFFDSLDHDLVVKAVTANITTEQRWVLLYVKRWLMAPLQHPDGTLQVRGRGTPQGSALTAPTQWGNFTFEVTLGYRRLEKPCR